MVFDEMGKPEEALENYNKSLEIKIQVVGHNHPLAADTYLNIGNVYSRQKKFPETLEMYQKCLEIRTKVLGPDHPLVETLCLKIVPPLLSVHQGNVVESAGCDRVVLAVDFDLDLE